MGPKGWLSRSSSAAGKSKSAGRGGGGGVDRGGLHHAAKSGPGAIVDHYMATQATPSRSGGYHQHYDEQLTTPGRGGGQGPTFFTYSMYEADSQSHKSPGRGPPSSRSHYLTSSDDLPTTPAGRRGEARDDVEAKSVLSRSSRTSSGRGSAARSASRSRAYGNSGGPSGVAGRYAQQQNEQFGQHGVLQRSHSRSQSRSLSLSNSRSQSHGGHSSFRESDDSDVGDNSVYTQNTLNTNMYSQYGGVNVTSSMVSGADRNYARYQKQLQKERSTSKSRGHDNYQKHADPYAQTAASTSGSGSYESEESNGGKKLVVQYSLVKNDEYGGGGGGGAHGAEDEVKVKARVENASLSLEECLDIQLEEESRLSEMDRIGRKMYDRETHKQKKVYSHYINPTSEQIDASDAIGIISSYITAYRALHQTTDRAVHKHDKVLVTKAQGALGRAVIELAISAGSAQVFGICPAKYHSRISRWGATALDEKEFLTWSEGLMGAVDIVIDIDGDHGDISSAAALTANQMTGKLVRVFTNGPDGVAYAESSSGNSSGRKSPFSRGGSNKNLRREPPNTAYYDLFTDMEEDPLGFRSDLQLLFDMVGQGYVRPRKKKAIPLVGMEYVEVKFERPPDGSFRSSHVDYGRSQGMTIDGGGRSVSSRRRRDYGGDDDKSAKSGRSHKSGRSRSSHRSRSRGGRSEQRDDIDNKSHSAAADQRDDGYQGGNIERERSLSRGRQPHVEEEGRGRGRSLSRPRFLTRSRSKSRSRKDAKGGGLNSSSRQLGGDARSSCSRSRHEGDDWDNQSAKSSRSGRSKSSTRSKNGGGGRLIKRSLSLTNFRRKSFTGGENDYSHANDTYDEAEEPWDSGYDCVKKEHGNQYSNHYLMRDMSTQSFLLALGKDPNAGK